MTTPKEAKRIKLQKSKERKHHYCLLRKLFADILTTEKGKLSKAELELIEENRAKNIKERENFLNNEKENLF